MPRPKSDPKTEKWVEECVDAMAKLRPITLRPAEEVDGAGYERRSTGAATEEDGEPSPEGVVESRVDLILSKVDVHAPLCHVDGDNVPVLQSSDGAAARRFRRDVADHESVGGS